MDSTTDRLPQQALAKQRSDDFLNFDHVSLSEPYGGCDCKACRGEVCDRPDTSFDPERLTAKDRRAQAKDIPKRYEETVKGRHSVREPVKASRAAQNLQHADKATAWCIAAPSTTNNLSRVGRTTRKEEDFDHHQGDDTNDSANDEEEMSDGEDGWLAGGHVVDAQREEAATRQGLPARHLGQLHRLPSGAAASSADYRQPPPWCPNPLMAASDHRAWSRHEPVRSDWLRVICSDEHDEQADRSSSHDDGHVTKTDGVSGPVGRSAAEARQARDREATRAVEDAIEKNGEVKALWAAEEDGEILLGQEEKGGGAVGSVGTQDRKSADAQAERPVMGVEQGQVKNVVASLGADDGDWELL